MLQQYDKKISIKQFILISLTKNYITLMNKKADMEKTSDLDRSANSTGICAEDHTPTNSICDPDLQESIQSQTQDCIHNFNEVIQMGKQLIKKLARQKNIQGLAAISCLLKKSSECYAPAVKKLRANPLIIRLFDPNSANREALAKELESTNDDTIFRVVNIFLSETVPCSQGHAQAVRRVLYNNYVVKDTNLDLIKKELNESYHSFNLFKEASMHLKIGFLSLQQHFTEEADCSFMEQLHQQFVWVEVKVKISHFFIRTLQQIQKQFRKIADAQTKKNNKQAKGQEKILFGSENFQQVMPYKSLIAENKASKAQEAQLSKKQPDLSKKQIGQQDSIFTNVLSRVIKSLFFKQQTNTKAKYDDEDQRQNLILDKGQKKSK